MNLRAPPPPPVSLTCCVQVVRAIAECAFVTSPLPVCLSLEMHCDEKGQKKIAEYIIRYMGDRLYYPPEDSAEGQTDGKMPSPWY
eukprot:4502130-Prymnesium_polylepis.1